MAAQRMGKTSAKATAYARWRARLSERFGEDRPGRERTGPRVDLPSAVIGVAIFGIVFESIGDWQLTVFRKNPANAGQVLSTGLWRYTRHPNYFGDACVWWGLFLIGAETSLGWLAIPGPILLTWTLMKWSGAPTLEFRMRKTKPGYAEYIARTSGFVPWPPKRA